MHWKLAFPSRFISAADLRGKEAHLTIAKASLDEVTVIDGKGKGKEKQKKLVLGFEEVKGRGEKEPHLLCCNRTNAKTIAKLHGTETSKWIGRRITLYPTTCLAFGETVDCIRIREKAPPPKPKQAKNQAPPPQPENEPSPYEAEE